MWGSVRAALKSFCIHLLYCHLSPALKEIIWGLLSCVLVLRVCKSCRLGCPPLLRILLCCQTSTKETLIHPYRGWTACTANRNKSSTWEESSFTCPSLVHAGCPALPTALFLLLFSVSSCYLTHRTANPLDHWPSFLWLFSTSRIGTPETL